MESPALIVIFGAAVRADGTPSPALARRIGYALEAARVRPEALVFCSGGVGEVGPSEASVMAEALAEAGVARRRLVLDEASLDTLDSVVAVARFLKARGAARCIVCSDRYHLPRIRLMLRALGIAADPGPLAPGRGGTRRAYWWKMQLREALAIPYDLALVLLKRRRLLA
ncbi:YdcF family protein [Phenylobacterium sp. J367]|uniref:YdcF family protein n=1 Tax=Phenylobacterium sp. J367 TaxID=2898435 RepID=UPI0021519310|nr:YdcF family protein [Phenylobacterium sp. J367]MCR5879798.1 YdcF family protein [Phenylobacterium sp. J367]